MSALVQTQTVANDASGTTLGLTLSTNVTSGNLIHVFIFYHAGAGISHSVSDNLGNTYILIDAPIRTNRQVAHYYASNISGGSCTITLTTSNNNQYRSIAAVEISGITTVSPLDGFSSSVQETPGTGADVLVSGAVTATAAGYLSACSVQVADIGGMAPPNSGTGFVNDGAVFPIILGSIARLEHSLISAGSRQATFTPTYSGGGAHITTMAIFKDVAAGGSPSVTDVDTDEIVLDGQTGVVITGTDMGADNSARVITLRQGSTSVPQTETGSGTATSATVTISIEQSGADIKFGAATLRVTRTGDSSYGDISITVNPSSGQLYRDVGTPNSTAANRITAVGDIATGDQLHARGVGGGSAPTGLSLNTDGTFEFSNGSTPTSFDARVWDTSDSTWGAWATQNIDQGPPPDPGARYLVLVGS